MLGYVFLLTQPTLITDVTHGSSKIYKINIDALRSSAHPTSYYKLYINNEIRRIRRMC